MEIIKEYLTRNPCWYANEHPETQSNGQDYVKYQKHGPEGGMLHSVGTPQPSASVFTKNWNRETYGNACVHAFIDANDGTVHETLDHRFRGWHGGGSCNNTHFGVEMCEPDCIRYTSGAKFVCSDYPRAREMATRTYKSAVQYFAMYFKEFGIDPLKPGSCISHKEGYKMGIASGHDDPEHLWKGLGLPFTMDGFRQDVADTMKLLPEVKDTTEAVSQNPPTRIVTYRVRRAWDDRKSQIGAFTNLDYAKKTADANPGWLVFDDEGIAVYPLPIKAGDRVTVLDNLTYTGKRFKTYYDVYDVLQVTGDRAVIGIGNSTTCAIHIDNIARI